MNEKEKQTRQKRIEDSYETMRAELWPDLRLDELWHRKKNTGFTSIPRGLPLVHRIMDALSPGVPLSDTYFALWARLYDQSLVIIENTSEILVEVGFTGQRALNTWNGRMRKLSELGFIRAKEGASGDFHYVLVLNPYKVIKTRHKENPVVQRLYRALFERCNKIGADDLLEQKAKKDAA